jgi:hypothetical protein
MRRRIVHFAAAVSLLLLVATAVLWVRSYWREDVLSYRQGEIPDQCQRGEYLWSRHGRLALVWWLRQNPPPSPWKTRGPIGTPTWELESSPIHSTHQPSWHGFAYRFDERDNRTSGARLVATTPLRMTYEHEVTVPYGFIVLLTLSSIGFWIFRHRRVRRRVAEHRCLNCDYDLRATPDRCPECGAVPQPPHNPPMHRIAREAPRNRI